MNQRRESGGKEPEAEPPGKKHMLKIIFIHASGMLKKNLGNHRMALSSSASQEDSLTTV